ncbi:MAG: hypothetical protein LBS19_02135, partial [Clostridiales bacterium]|nr:hypothetical protein [Clostridiales bacterium]
MISLSPKMKFSLDGIGLSIFFAALATSGEVFAAAGGGSTIGGGGSGCNSSYSSTWDTCFGGSWRYFRLDTPVPVRANKQMETVTYDMGADRIVIPDASSNTQGGTISRCVADQSTGFFRFGLEVYAPSSNSSLGYQAGLIQKGSIKNAFDGSAQYKATDIPTDPSQMSSFIQNLPHGATFDNNAMHRLFNFVTENGQNDGFSWDDSSLAWFCTGMLEQGGGFASRSNVRIGGGSDYQTTDWVDKSTANAAGTAKSGDVVEITFSHDMKYTGELPNTTVKVEKAWTNTMTPTGASVQIIAPNTGKNPFVPTKKDQSEQVWQSHTYKVTMPTVAAGSTQKVTVCEQITYQDKQLEGGKWTGGESYSKACASITVSESTKTCEELGTCPQACPLPNSSYNIDFGGTQAQSGVVNLTKDGTWKTTDGKSTTPAFVWAKPGDSIQFKHTLCFGAQAVRGNNTDNGKTTVARTQKPSTANTATIKAFTAPSSSGNYLYGKTLTGTNSQTFNLAIGEAKPSQTSGADKSGDYWFTYNSPSIKAGNNAGDTYKCYAADRGFPSFKTNGYQIPDFISTTIPADCASAKKVPTNSDAGKIIEQDLEWNEVKSWLTTQSSGSVSGCGCGD